MRPNNPNKRLRGRNRSKNSNPLGRSYESNGPDVKIRGSALQVADKYAQLARDATSSGDRVMAENYFQHAEHYYRIVAAAYEQNNQRPPHVRQDERRSDDYRGDQPSINGFDGMDDEDDSGLRRAMGNGDRRTYDNDDDGDDEAPEHHRNGHRAQPHQHQPRHENGHTYNAVNGNGHAAEAETEETDVSVEATTVQSAGIEEEETGEAKPKRRRTPRTRTRRRTAADGEGTAPVAAPEPTEPTS